MTTTYSRTESSQLADAYAFIARNPRCLTSEVGAACPAYDWATAALERLGKIRRVALRPGEQVEGRWVTVASKIV
jgi:hypothetical protein